MLHLFNIILKVLDTEITQEKDIKASKLEREKKTCHYLQGQDITYKKNLKIPPKTVRINKFMKVAG